MENKPDGPQDSPSRSDWISVEERLPQQFQQVLVALKRQEYPSPEMVLAWQKRGTWFGMHTNIMTGVCEQGEIPEDFVTHWQPLPAPPSPAREKEKAE